ncbi:MAG TPA: hypothetical protein VF337_12555 [Candidatus Limnocylindrales bacterium]
MSKIRSGLLLTVSASVLLAVGAGCVQSGAETVAGQSPAAGASPTAVTSTSSPLSSASAGASLSAADAAAVDRAATLVKGLGGPVPPEASVSVTHQGHDGGPGTTVMLGQWLLEWDESGRLTNVVVALSAYAPSTTEPISEAAARTRVGDVLNRLGVNLGAPTEISYVGAGSVDWRAHWSRMLDGFPVPSDGTIVIIMQDGAFQSYSYTEAPSAPAPTTRITQAQAVAKTGRCRNITNGPNGLIESCTVNLEWHASQAEQSSLLQLCWRITTAWNDNDQNQGGAALWLDAGTGEVVDSASIS